MWLLPLLSYWSHCLPRKILCIAITSWHSSREAKVWMANKSKFLSYPSGSFWQTKVMWENCTYLSFSSNKDTLSFCTLSVVFKAMIILNSLNNTCQLLSQVFITPPLVVVMWAFCSVHWFLQWHASIWPKRWWCCLHFGSRRQSEWGPRKALSELELELHRNVSYPWNILLQADSKSNLK